MKISRIYVIVALVVGLLVLGLLWRPPGRTPQYRGEISIFNWSHYMSDQVLRDFTKETGITVKYATYSTNEEMLTKIQMGASYDLVFPTSYMVGIMVRKGLLRSIDVSRLDNWKDLDPDLVSHALDAYQSSEKAKAVDAEVYAVPYMWGTVGIGYDTSRVPKPNSLSVFAEGRYKQKVAFIDDARFVIGAFLVEQGYSPNSTNEHELANVEATLSKVRPNIRTINSEVYMEDLQDGIAWLAFGFNGDIHQVAVQNSKVAFAPPQRCLGWVDGMAVPKTAQHYNDAMSFINYILRPSVAAQITNEIQYASANKMALPFVDETIKRDPSIYVPDIGGCKYLKDIGNAAETYERMWLRLKEQP